VRSHQPGEETGFGRSSVRWGRASVLGTIVVLFTAITLLVPAASLPSAREQTVTVLRPGDVVRMKDTSVTCRVRGGNPPLLECLRLRKLAGSYGVRMSTRKVTVFRVKSAKLGETVFSATHNIRQFTTCRNGDTTCGSGR
jgi:hypothetical protein